MERNDFDLSKPNQKFVDYIEKSLIQFLNLFKAPISRLTLYCRTRATENQLSLLKNNIFINKIFRISEYNYDIGNLVLNFLFRDQVIVKEFPAPYYFLQFLLRNKKFIDVSKELNRYFYIEILITSDNAEDESFSADSNEIDEVNEKFESNSLELFLPEFTSGYIQLCLFKKTDFSELQSKKQISVLSPPSLLPSLPPPPPGYYIPLVSEQFNNALSKLNKELLKTNSEKPIKPPPPPPPPTPPTIDEEEI